MTHWLQPCARPLAQPLRGDRPALLRQIADHARTRLNAQAVSCAQQDPDGWRTRSAQQRSECLGRVAQELRRARADLIGVAMADGGKTVLESDPEIYEACRIAIEKRKTIGLKAQTGWSLAHMSNVYARLGQGDRAKEALDILARCCLGQNLFTYHNDWRYMGVSGSGFWGKSAPFQMDANFGISSALYEMLCGSNATVLRILPALPGDWLRGDFHGMLTRAGVKTSAAWDMNIKEIKISLVAERDAEFDLHLPGEIKNIECDQAELLRDSKYGANYRAIGLKKGEELELKVALK